MQTECKVLTFQAKLILYLSQLKKKSIKTKAFFNNHCLIKKLTLFLASTKSQVLMKLIKFKLKKSRDNLTSCLLIKLAIQAKQFIKRNFSLLSKIIGNFILYFRYLQNLFQSNIFKKISFSQNCLRQKIFLHLKLI